MVHKFIGTGNTVIKDKMMTRMMEVSPMKKQQYVAAVACLVAGAIGFVSVYATEKAQEKRELAVQESQQLSAASNELEPKPKTNTAAPKAVVPDKTPQIQTPQKVETADKQTEADQKEEVKTEKETEKEPKKDETVATAAADTVHFQPEDGILWPVEGEVLLEYSMDSTIYFPTLEQFRCNPALVIAGSVNDKVYAVAKGKIIEVFDSEETGCTVKQDLGDGYVAVYGQLKELNFNVGDTIESGQVVGYVSEPTKYYSTEGTNVYFSLQKDGSPVDPTQYLPEQVMDTLE